MLRLTISAFLRDTLGKRHGLYQDVREVPALTVERAKTSGLSVADAIAVREALGTSSAKAAAAWWALCVTGMRPAEYWRIGRASWELRSDRLHVEASKAKGGTKPRDVPVVDRAAVLHAPAITWDTFRDDMWKLRSGRGPFRTPWPTRITPYVARRTFAHWMEMARIPRSRRMLYRGSGPSDVTALYEEHEVAAFLVEDTAVLRQYIGLTDNPQGLTLIRDSA
jgi:integrase